MIDITVTVFDNDIVLTVEEPDYSKNYHYNNWVALATDIAILRKNCIFIGDEIGSEIWRNGQVASHIHW